MSLSRCGALGMLIWMAACSGGSAGPVSGLEVPELEGSEPGAPEPAALLEVVPEPSLEGMEPEVREVLRAASQSLTQLSSERIASGGEEDARRLAEIYGQNGLLYHGFGLEGAAAMCYRNASRLNPMEPKWLYLSAILSQGHRDLEAAAGLFGQVLGLDPAHVPSLLRSAEVFRLQGRADEAEARFQRILDDPTLSAHPGARPYALWGLAKLANAQGKAERVVELLRSAISQQPEADALFHALASAHRRLGDREQAAEASSKAGAQAARFEDPWSELIRPAEGATAQLLLGNAQLRVGNPQAALSYHRRAHRLNPQDPAAARALALTLEELGQTAESLELYAEAGRLSAANPLYLYDWARAAMKAGTAPEQVAPELERALAAAPDFLNGHLLLATCRTRMGEVEAAMESLQRALELSPGEPRATVALAGLWARRAHQSLSDGDVASTLQFLKKAVELAPTEVSLRLDLGSVLMSSGAFKDAAEHLQAALASDPRGDLAREIRLKLVEALLFSGRAEDGGAILMAWLERPGPSVAVLTLAAQWLAVGPETLRDERRAAQLAQQGFETQATPEGAETMALVLSAAGDFATAILWQERLVEQIQSLQADGRTLRRLERNLKRYRDGRRGLAPWQVSEPAEKDPADHQP